jgi:hypothetical protein
MKTGEFARRMKNGEPQSNEHASGEQVADPAPYAILFWCGKRFRGAASAKSKRES